MTCSMFKRGHENEGAGQDLGIMGGLGKFFKVLENAM